MNIREEETTMNIQDLFNERNEQNKRITELVLKLEKQKEVLDKIKEYCSNIKNLYWVEDDEPRYVSKDILEILEEIE